MVRRKLLLSVVVVGMISSAAFALAPLGPPAAGLDQGQYGAGIVYGFSDMTLELSGPLSSPGGHPGEAVINDVQTNLYMVGLGYGISNDWSLYGGVGFANAEFPGDGSAADFEGDDGFSFAIGTKRTLAESEDTKWGVVAQLTQGKSEDNVRLASPAGTWGNGRISMPSGSSVSQTKLEWYEVQLAVGPTVPLSEDVCIYGGPFLHFAEADLELKGNSRYEYEIEQKLQLGAYIGTLISLGDPNASLMAELLYTGEGWGVGIGAMIRCP